MNCENCDSHFTVLLLTEEAENKYCPVCGEPLAQPEPLTLEQLKQMDGGPVWSIGIGEYDYAFGWALPNSEEDQAYANDGATWAYDEYGITWVAYTSQPKEIGRGERD